MVATKRREDCAVLSCVREKRCVRASAGDVRRCELHAEEREGCIDLIVVENVDDAEELKINGWLT